MSLKKIFILAMMPLLTVSLTSCVFVVAGTIGAVGGYAVTRDTIQGEYDAPYGKAWTVSSDVCGILGSVVSRDRATGTINAVIDQAKVKVEVIQLTPEAIRIKVKARRGFFPRVGTSEKVFVKIVQELR